MAKLSFLRLATAESSPCTEQQKQQQQQQQQQ